jgi:hypothetical protein
MGCAGRQFHGSAFRTELHSRPRTALVGDPVAKMGVKDRGLQCFASPCWACATTGANASLAKGGSFPRVSMDRTAPSSGPLGLLRCVIEGRTMEGPTRQKRSHFPTLALCSRCSRRQAPFGRGTISRIAERSQRCVHVPPKVAGERKVDQPNLGRDYTLFAGSAAGAWRRCSGRTRGGPG